MMQTGAARFARHEAAGAIGTPVRESSPLSTLPERSAWTALKPAFSAGALATGAVVMGTAATGALLQAPFVPFGVRHRTIVRGLSRAAWNTGLVLEVTYDPDFDPQRPAVFCQNHISMLDGPLAAAVIPQPFCGLMNHWHFRIPGYGWLMQLGKSIPVYPRSAGRTAEITEAARERAAEGISILTFPEGHRTLDGNVRPYRRGAFFMARDAGIPVVPMVVRGLYGVNRKGTWMFEPGLVQVYLGPHVETAGLDDDAVSALAERFTRFADVWVREGRADVEELR